MKTLAFTAPIQAGQTEAAKRFGQAIMGPRQQEMSQSRQSIGQTRETVWVQPTPMGDALVVYLEGQDPVQANRAFAASTTPFDRWFKQQAQAITGIDFDQPLPEGFSQPVYESVTPQATTGTKTIAVAVPILPGKMDTYLNFVDEVKGPRHSEMEAFHRRVGLTVENWYLQKTSQGDLLVVYLEGDIPHAFELLAQSNHPFDLWLKKVWLETEGVDYGHPLPGIPELAFDWHSP